MAMRLASLITCAVLVGCSIYKSQDRKAFESQSPTRVYPTGVATGVAPDDGAAITTGLGECHTLNAVPAWFVKQFPGPAAEILIASEDLEVWKQADPNGLVTVRSFRAVHSGTRACAQAFASEADWQHAKSEYLNQVASPVLD